MKSSRLGTFQKRSSHIRILGIIPKLFRNIKGTQRTSLLDSDRESMDIPPRSPALKFFSFLLCDLLCHCTLERQLGPGPGKSQETCRKLHGTHGKRGDVRVISPFSEKKCFIMFHNDESMNYCILPSIHTQQHQQSSIMITCC